MKLLPATLLLATGALATQLPQPPDAPDSAHFQLEDLLADLDPAAPWHTLLDLPTLELGLYHLPRGAADHQRPHTRDEIYYVTSGRATLTAGTREHPVRPGSILYVRAGLEHRFHHIEEDLTTLVFFSNATPPRPARAD